LRLTLRSSRWDFPPTIARNIVERKFARAVAWMPMLGIVVAFAPSAKAATYYVDRSSSSCSNSGSGSSSSPYCTISAAMTARAASGVTILVKPGVYAEQVTVSASGTASSPFVIQATGPGVIVDGSDDFGATSLWITKAGDVWLAASVTTAPIQVFADGARLLFAVGTPPDKLPAHSWVWISGEGLYVNAGGGNPGTHQTRVGQRSYGFRLDRRSWVTVTGFQVRNCESRDIYLTGPLTGTLITDNLCTFSGKNGIAALSCSSVVIRKNVCSDHLDHGIYLQYTVKSTIEDNESMRNARPGVRAANGINLNRSSGNLIQRNRLHHNQDTGLDFATGANDNLSRQNLLYLNGDHGTDHVDCSGNTHIGDIAYRNYKDGFSFEGSAPNHKVFNCIGVENGIAVHPADGTLEFDLWIDKSSIPGFQSDYNIWWNSSSAVPPIKYVATRYAKLGDYQVASGQDAHSFQLDPMFADTSHADFHLRDGSPAVDAGTSAIASWPSTDFDGRARWDDPRTPNTGAGTVPYGERGAFEFFANTTPVAVLKVDLATGGAPLALTASGASSTDKDGKIVSYQFDFGDGTIVGPQASATASHVYPAIGEYTLTLTIADDREGADTSAVPITVVPNHATNPGFESTPIAWTKYGTATLTQVAGGHSGGWALQVKGGSSSSSAFGADDSPNQIATTPGFGSRYRFGAWVRSPSNTGKVVLEVREWLGTSQKGSTTKSSTITLSPNWQHLSVDYTTTTDGTTLDWRIVDTPNKSSETWLIDDLSIEQLWAPPPAPPPPGNLVDDWSFETNPTRWVKYGSATMTRVVGGHSGGYAYQIKGGSSSSAVFGIDDNPNWVLLSAGAGRRYRFGAWVRSPSFVGKASLEVREYLGTLQRGVTVKSSLVALSTAWQYLTVDYVVTTPGTTLDFRIVDAPTKSSETWFVDDVSIFLIKPDAPPKVSAPESVTVVRGQLVTVDVGAVDPDNQAIDALAANLSGLPIGSDALFIAAADHASGTLSWTPAAADIRALPYRVTFTATNALADTAATWVTVIDTTHEAPPDTTRDLAPVVSAPESLSVQIGHQVVVTVSAADPDSQAIDSLAADFSGLPTGSDAVWIAAADHASGTVSWTPVAADIRALPYRVTFTATNARADTAATWITVIDTTSTYTPPETTGDRAPVVTAPESLSVLRGHPVVVTVSAADPDSQAIDSLIADLSGLPNANDAAFTPGADSGTGTFTWTPAAADIRAMPYVVTFSAMNSLKGTALTKITIVDTLIAAPADSDTVATPPPPPPPPPAPSNLVGNPGFESGLTGWGTYGTATLARVVGGHGGDYALQISGSGSFGCDDVPNVVATVAGAAARYTVSAWVRSASNVGKVKIRIYEYQGTTQQGTTVYSQEVPLTTSWQQLVAHYTVLKAGSSLSIRITDAPIASSEVFLVDDISIVLDPTAALVASRPTESVAATAVSSEARAFALDGARLGSADETPRWSVRIQGADGPAWDGQVPRVVLRAGERELAADRLGFGDDADRDGIEELEAVFDTRAVRALLGDAGERESMPVTVSVTAPSGVSWSTSYEVAIAPAPLAYAASSFPNPMRGAGTITFTLTRPGFARVALYDASGRLVRHLFERDALSPGRFQVAVPGARGTPLANGMYFYRIESREGTLRGRIAIVR
jgi:parallel beta-helix repeat protein